MILDLDIGNTRVKWRLRHAGGAIGEQGACVLEDLLGGAAAIPADLIERIRAACVRGAPVEQQVARWAHGLCAQPVQFARSSARAAGVTNAYARPETLGVDRWLAMLAAWNLERGAAVCVISCGSAITVDLVDAQGHHRGGLIAPGLAMMKRSLLSDTDRVRFDPADTGGLQLLPGRSTQACVAAGVSTAAVGLINQACTEYRRLCPETKAFITGGDAGRILPFLTLPAEHRQALVLDGLQVLLP